MKRKSKSIYFNISSKLIFRCFGFSPLVKQQVGLFSSLRLMAASWKMKTRFPGKSMIHLSATMSRGFTIYLISCSKECAEVHWLRHCATRRKFDGSIPDGVIGISHWFRRHFGLRLDSASNRHEYQDYLLAGKGCRCHSMCVLCIHFGSLKHLELVQTCKGFALLLWDNKNQIFFTQYIQCSLSPLLHTSVRFSASWGLVFMNQNSCDLWIHFQNSTSLHYFYVHNFTALKRRRPSRIFDESGPSNSKAKIQHMS
jgi:hypothetical protein